MVGSARRGAVQATEDWIHEQDVRRGGAAAPRQPIDDSLAPRLWSAAKRFAANTLSIPAEAVIELTDGTRQHRLRSRRWAPLALPTAAETDVVIFGPAAEILLYAVGRDGAGVTVTGDPGACALLERDGRSV